RIPKAGGRGSIFLGSSRMSQKAKEDPYPNQTLLAWASEGNYRVLARFVQAPYVSTPCEGLWAAP
ncbi:hypothetical protein CMI37_20540, partial [Candidatus Pacearchaeota archaeon]|nr:hypothetical protein [Candidatus Pacearchaeota archaeon]